MLNLLLAYRGRPSDDLERRSDRPGFDAAGTLLLALTLAAYALAMTTGRDHFAPRP
ncbi:hypothetical protein [Deinococcus petrolearius]|uniref:Uncharacterized protein n=1 Tax=Deinococcus petrolearius TaxID=1751295 RepID=A0ABW1DNL1_9DEIO